MPVIRRPAFRRGLVEGAPVVLVVLPFGVAFGVLAVGVMPGWLAMMTSLLVVSGAAQFAMVGLAAAGPEAILVAATGLALRHVPMSATLSSLIGSQPLRIRAGLAWVLVDETFGLTVDASRRGIDDLVGYKAAIDLELYTAWMAGTAIGVLVGPVVDPVALGVEILFPLLFLGLAAPLLRSRRHWVAATSAVVFAILATLVLPEAWQVTAPPPWRHSWGR